MSFSLINSGIQAETHLFRPISLGEMENVMLMDRTDTKFVIPIAQLPEILEVVRPGYRILEINKKREFRYETLYYDTHELRLYQQHQAGHLNRYKVRQRNYQDSGTAFLEIKFKNNKGRTIKTRMHKNETLASSLDKECTEFIRTNCPLDPAALESILLVHYTRITLVSTRTLERLTIDLNLTFENKGKIKKFPDVAIAELKQERAGKSSAFLKTMQQYRLRPGAISKYCLGIISLFEHVKQNRFKSHLNALSKIRTAHGNIPLL